MEAVSSLGALGFIPYDHQKPQRIRGRDRPRNLSASQGPIIHPHTLCKMGFRWLLASLQVVLLARMAFAAFSLTESGNNFIVDTNAGLIFTGASTRTHPMPFDHSQPLTVARNSGDIVSMLFNGIEVRHNHPRTYRNLTRSSSKRPRTKEARRATLALV
jgi:hypothetical protein